MSNTTRWVAIIGGALIVAASGLMFFSGKPPTARSEQRGFVAQ